MTPPRRSTSSCAAYTAPVIPSIAGVSTRSAPNRSNRRRRSMLMSSGNTGLALALVCATKGSRRKADAGVAGGGLHQRVAGVDLPGRLGRLDHRLRDAILHGAAGVEHLELAEDLRHARPG